MKLKLTFLILPFIFLNFAEARFSNLKIASPFIENGGSGCDDHNCIWLTGKNFKATNTVILFIPNTFFSLATYNVEFTANNQNSGKDLITFRITDTSVQEIFASSGLRVQIIDNTTGERSAFSLLKKETPQPPPPPSVY
ncbi:MAG: hypothetical protein IPM57_09515 [Oligoflexia bacterium]|nr:hypothetical protein [Oligoflexia bacterium]